MNYIAYPKKKDTPSRMSRKRARITTFMKNKAAKKLLKKLAKKQALEALAEQS